MLWILAENIGDRERQIVANQVVAGVAEEDTGKHASAIMAIAAIELEVRHGGDYRCTGTVGRHENLP